MQRSLTTEWQLGCCFFAAVRSTFCHRVIQRSLTTDWQFGCWFFAAVRSTFCHRLIQRSLTTDWQSGCWFFVACQVDILSQTHTEIFDDWLTVRMLFFSRRSGRHFVTESYRDLWRLVVSWDVDFSRWSGRHFVTDSYRDLWWLIAS